MVSRNIASVDLRVPSGVALTEAGPIAFILCCLPGVNKDGVLYFLGTHLLNPMHKGTRGEARAGEIATATPDGKSPLNEDGLQEVVVDKNLPQRNRADRSAGTQVRNYGSSRCGAGRSGWTRQGTGLPKTSPSRPPNRRNTPGHPPPTAVLKTHIFRTPPGWPSWRADGSSPVETIDKGPAHRRPTTLSYGPDKTKPSHPRRRRSGAPTARAHSRSSTTLRVLPCARPEHARE